MIDGNHVEVWISVVKHVLVRTVSPLKRLRCAKAARSYIKAATTIPASPANATWAELSDAPLLLLSIVGLIIGATVVGVPSAPVVVVGRRKVDDAEAEPVPVAAKNVVEFALYTLDVETLEMVMYLVMVIVEVVVEVSATASKGRSAVARRDDNCILNDTRLGELEARWYVFV